MGSSLTASLFLLSVVFMQFVSAADQSSSPIKATVGDDVFLPCRAPDQGEIRLAEWSRTDLGPESVLLYRNYQIDPAKQHPSYRDRVDLLINQVNKGDVSLILKDTTTDDSGTYECRVLQGGLEKKLIRTISLQVSPPPPPEPFPVWVIVLLVLLVLLVLAAAAGVSVYFWLRWKPVQVEAGVESVLLPWRWGDQLVSRRSTASLPADVRAVWRDDRGRKVHVHQNASDCNDEQNQRYKNRTSMDKNFSLTLSWPTYEDRGIFTCTVYRDGVVLMKKDVWLKVKVHQVEVEPGVESVLLPCRTTESLDGDVRVEWMDGDNIKVHVYQNSSDQPGEQQHPSYKGRTRMDENLLENKNLSLTLEYPTISDTFTCRVSRGGDVLMVKQVQLEVKDQQVEVEEGAESVKLEFKVTFDLHMGDRVEWWDKKERIVHVYQNSSDQPVEQDPIYKDRTRMNKDALETKDLSLTLIRPTERDISRFRCGVYRKGELLRIKSTQLSLKAKRSLVQPKDIRKPLLADQSV